MNRSKLITSLVLVNCGIFVAALWFLPLAKPQEYFPADAIDFVLKYTYYEFAWPRVAGVMLTSFFLSAGAFCFVGAIVDFTKAQKDSGQDEM